MAALQQFFNACHVADDKVETKQIRKSVYMQERNREWVRLSTTGQINLGTFQPPLVLPWHLVSTGLNRLRVIQKKKAVCLFMWLIDFVDQSNCFVIGICFHCLLI